MTIKVISAQARTNVLWLGEAVPNDTRLLIERFQFSIDTASPASALSDDGFLGGLAAVVFSQRETKPLPTVTDLKAYVARLLDFDCLVLVFAANSGLSSVKKALTRLRITAIWPTAGPEMEVFDGIRVVRHSTSGDPPLPHVRVYRVPPPPEGIVHLLIRYGPQHAPAPDIPGLFEITGPAQPAVRRGDRLLLRRSFHDCSRLHLKRLGEGRSGVRVFLAHATLRQAPMERRPLPFFVKVGHRGKIFSEWSNYETRVRQYVPFHLGPRLVGERCALSSSKGIIVGDFVEDSESFGDCSRGARASTPTGTLFDRTLRGWHSQAVTVRHSLAAAMQGLLSTDVPNARAQMAMALGAKRAPAALKGILMSRAKEPLQWGPIHGDLHAENARARGADAILIDFLASRDGPLLADPAALEVSLAVRAPCDDDFDQVAWERTVASLYSKDAFRLPLMTLTTADPAEPYAWLASCVRQIRLHALAMQTRPGQYAAAVAYQFFHAASKDPKASQPEEFRRVTAYRLADGLVDLVWP